MDIKILLPLTDPGFITVTFDVGITTASLNVSITDDNILGSNETFYLRIVPYYYANVHGSLATVVIVEDDCKWKIYIKTHGNESCGQEKQSVQQLLRVYLHI